MKIHSALISILLGIIGACALSADAPDAPVPGRRERSFNEGWKFFRGDVAGADNPEFEDAAWRALDLPHDWSIEDIPGPQTETQIGPFQKAAPGGFLTGNTVGGTGWYRKQFTLSANEAGRLVSVLFEGICNEAQVWINGTHLGFHPNGATSFAYDLTPYLRPAGRTNVLAIKVTNNGDIGMNEAKANQGKQSMNPMNRPEGLGWSTSRWYTGSGIYRNVWLTVTDPLHVAQWGVQVTTPVVQKDTATVNLIISLENDTGLEKDATVTTTLTGPDGRAVATTTSAAKIAGRSGTAVSQGMTVANPSLWSPDSPALYQAKVEVRIGGTAVDNCTTIFGIRSLSYDAAHGILLNGQSVKLRGGSVHDNNGLLGAASFDRAEERRIELLKAAGFNAIRTAHNPPSPALLDACDRLGMMVIDEAFDTWERVKVARDNHLYFRDWWERDLTSILLRDRNHPSVIMWSIGNEILERSTPEGMIIRKRLIETVRKHDTTRLINEAVPFDLTFTKDAPTWEQGTAPIFELLDIAGYNYTWNEWLKDHEKHPERVMMSTESYPKDMFEIWSLVEQHPWIVGDFVWTSMDYLGEAGIGSSARQGEKANYAFGSYSRTWPWTNAWCGDIDILGGKKPQSFYRDVVWRRSQMEIAVAMPDPAGRKEVITAWGWRSELPSWTWPGEEGKKLQQSRPTAADELSGEKWLG
ncbi:MAG: glycoside hydrolase family 2 TIM barrel-domain containing protein [Lacunisphaera sp.]|nr:glycoside hydrolase family 2 TIM barrel-domain containing protein [Lacunisphaera sp.]